MRYSDSKGTGIKCRVLCPIEVCGKKIVCINKKYVRGGMQKNKKTNAEIGNNMYRRALWYFSNLKTHLEYHQGQLGSQEENLLSLSTSFHNEDQFPGRNELLPGGASTAHAEGAGLSLNENDDLLHENVFTPTTRFQSLNTGLKSPLLSSPLSQIKSSRKDKVSSVQNLIHKFSANE